MRQVLVDHARARAASKRGGGATFVDLDDAEAASAPPTVDVLALHEALDRLAALDASQERLVEMRYFGGLTIEETAEVLAQSPATVKRDWASARAWLLREMSR
jgi:RNA polymerase sigma factor (TIGR02999 family)